MTPTPAGRRRILVPLALLALVLAACTSSPRTGRGPGVFAEKLIDVPRATRIKVGVGIEKARLDWLETHNAPDPAEVAGQGGKSFVLFRFYYSNDDYLSHRASIRILLLDAAGGVLAEGGRNATLDAGVKEDTISFPVSVRNDDWLRAARVKVLATFLD